MLGRGWCGPALTRFREVAQGAAEGAALEPLASGVAVVQAGPAQRPAARLLLEAGALGHAGPHDALLLLQLRCDRAPAVSSRALAQGRWGVAAGPGNPQEGDAEQWGSGGRGVLWAAQAEPPPPGLRGDGGARSSAEELE